MRNLDSYRSVAIIPAYKSNKGRGTPYLMDLFSIFHNLPWHVENEDNLLKRLDSVGSLYLTLSDDMCAVLTCLIFLQI